MAKENRASNQPSEFYIQALLLAEVGKRILTRKAAMKLSSKPTFELKPIVEFRKRMRVSSLEKFPVKTYISVINFYLRDSDVDKNKVIGTLIVYIPEDFIIKLFQALNYPELDEDDTLGLEDACGTFCNLIAGNFKSSLTQLGYHELIMSPFFSFENELARGVNYPFTQNEYYEISFEIKNQKCIMMDLALGQLTRGQLTRVYSG